MILLELDLGHHIIIYTARRMRTHKGNVGSIVKDIAAVTLDTLSKYKIPYDELFFGKPYAHYYIDDLGVSAHLNLEKELGFYQTHIKERDFHKVQIKDGHVIKSSKREMLLDGEIYWYLNIPDKIKTYFPKLLHYTINEGDSQLIIDKINGITLSNLFSNSGLADKVLDNLMYCIHEIHTSIPENEIRDSIKNNNVNIYHNYGQKLSNRYQTYDYSGFNRSDEVYHKLISYFEQYEQNDQGDITVIHGDPVFTNVLLNQSFDLKFIDMRGKIGNVCTIYGDKYYDYGKIYQSLLGYDIILSGKEIDKSYQSSLISRFESYFDQDELNKIRYITASLLFSLIPLHDNDKCNRYYNLILSNNLLSLDE